MKIFYVAKPKSIVTIQSYGQYPPLAEYFSRTLVYGSAAFESDRALM
jgi:hypothetical protein